MVLDVRCLSWTRRLRATDGFSDLLMTRGSHGVRETLGTIRAALRRWQDAAETVPRLVHSAVRRGILPVGIATVSTFRREGLSELHWKVLGDALVRFFQGSGPFLTKVGQILATRNDLLPETVCVRLEALYTDQPPMPKRKLKRFLKKAYAKGTPFKEFRTRPIAVGSIGQVHRARLKDGQQVVVKVLRPGVERAIRRDINAAHVFLNIFFGSFSRTKKSTQFVAQRALEDLARAYETELDLENEARTLEEFRKRFKKNSSIYVPICYREWSSKSILVLEELSGEPLSAFRERSRSNPEAAKEIAHLALKEILTQIFDEGRFHADPHGGNLLILEDGRLGLIDLGLTGELNARDRKNITKAVRAFLAKDANASLRALLEFGTVPPDFNLDAFKADIRAVFRKSGAKALAHVSGQGAMDEADSYRLEELVNGLFRVAHRHKIYLPPSTTLLIKTLVTIEGVARSLNPNINVVVTAIPIILKSLAPKWLRWNYWTGHARKS